MEPVINIPSPFFREENVSNDTLFIPAPYNVLVSRNGSCRIGEKVDRAFNQTINLLSSEAVEVQNIAQKKSLGNEDTKKIEAFVKKYFPNRTLEPIIAKIQSLYPNSTITNSEKEGHSSTSGDAIFFARDKTTGETLVVKAFIKPSSRDRKFKGQIEGTKKLLEFAIDGMHPQKCIASYPGNEHEPFHLLVLAYAEGVVLDHTFAALNKHPENMEQLRDSFYKVGQLYARMHATTESSEPPPALTENWKKEEFWSPWKQCRDLLSLHPELFGQFDLDEMHKCMELLLTAYEKNPGQASYIHGDPHPGNWIMNNGKLTLIDLVAFGKGSPAQELFSARSCIAFHASSYKYKLEEAKSHELQECFTRGYLSEAKPDYATHEAKCFFFAQWALLNIRGKLDVKKKEQVAANAPYIINMLNAIRDKNPTPYY